jgi:hypothetical protein
MIVRCISEPNRVNDNKSHKMFYFQEWEGSVPVLLKVSLTHIFVVPT